MGVHAKPFRHFPSDDMEVTCALKIGMVITASYFIYFQFLYHISIIIKINKVPDKQTNLTSLNLGNSWYYKYEIHSGALFSTPRTEPTKNASRIDPTGNQTRDLLT